MAAYVVLAPPPAEKADLPEALRFVFVKDGFCWPALFVPLLWMLWRRLFLAAALYVLVGGALIALVLLAGAPAVLLLLAARIGFAVLANDMRRFILGRRGYVPVGAASGRSIDEAEIRYFLNRADASPPQEQVVPFIPLSSAAAGPGPVTATVAGPVIGLFPNPEAAP